jgi:uncharacterized protein
MNRVFVDTGGFYAALNRRDASHRDAARLFRRAQREHWFLFTTNFVLAESHALILARMGRDRAWGFLQAIVTGSTNVIRVEEVDERRARAINRAISGQSVQLLRRGELRRHGTAGHPGSNRV